MKASERRKVEENLCNGRLESGVNSRAPSYNLTGMDTRDYPPGAVANLVARRLIMDGALSLTRVVRKATIAFEVIDSHGDASTVQVECLAPEMTPRTLIGILCNDLLVLCRDPSHGQDPNSQVDLWAVLRMQTLPQPASIVHGNG